MALTSTQGTSHSLSLPSDTQMASTSTQGALISLSIPKDSPSTSSRALPSLMDLHKAQASLTDELMTQDDISSASSSEEIKISTDLDVQTIDEVVKTKIGMAILKIMGQSEELVAYDNIRTTIKQNGSNSQKADITKYNRLQTNLQTKILSKKSELKSMISNFEREYYTIHKRLPRTTDSEDYSQMLKKLKLIKHLLSHWNITL